MNTVLISLFGGPGCGKSTGAAYIYSALKMKGYNAELATEYAKDRVWQEDYQPLKHNQLYIAGKQHQRICRLLGKVDIIVTDSPLILSCLYIGNKAYKKDLVNVLKIIYEETPSLNVLLKRVKKYEQAGRYQDENGAIELDKQTIHLLKDLNMNYIIENGDKVGYDIITDKAIDFFKEQNK